MRIYAAANGASRPVSYRLVGSWWERGTAGVTRIVLEAYEGKLWKTQGSHWRRDHSRGLPTIRALNKHSDTFLCQRTAPTSASDVDMIVRRWWDEMADLKVSFYDCRGRFLVSVDVTDRTRTSSSGASK